MSTLKTPFRYDFVGSFLRPEKLKAAKKAFEEGTITQEELDRVTDECVTEIVAKQKVAGYHAITDGEFRRKFWHLDFMWGFEGVTHEKDGGGVQFNGEMADLEATYLVGKVKAKVHPFVEYFKFLKQFEDEQTVAKYTIPAPAQMYQQMIVPQNIEQTRKFYATDDELIEDIGKAYQDVIKQFYSAGCRNLQLDDCTWGAIVGDAAKQRYQSLGVDIEEVKARMLEQSVEHNLDELLVMAESGRYSTNRINSCIGRKHKLDYVYPIENTECLCEINTVICNNLLQMLGKEMHYDCIVLNMGTRFKGFFDILDRCSDIYLVQKKGGISQWREYEFTEELIERGLSNVVERIKLIEPPVITTPVSTCDKLVELWKWNEFGDVIRNMTRGISCAG